MDHKEPLRTMLQDIINDKMDQATVAMHDYFVAKTRQVSGLGTDEVEPSDDDNTVDEAVDTE